MSVHLNVPELRSSQVQSAPIHHAEALPLQGIASDQSTLLSLREHANAEAAFSFCSCFESLINWIRDCFSNIFASRTSTRTSTPVTHDSLIRTANGCLSAQLYTANLSYPVKAIVFIKNNGTLVATPHREIASSPDLLTFETEVRGVLAQLIRSQDLAAEGPAELEFDAVYFINRASDFEVIKGEQRIDMKTGADSGRPRSSSVMSTMSLSFYLHGEAGDQLTNFERFIMPEYMRQREARIARIVDALVPLPSGR